MSFEENKANIKKCDCGCVYLNIAHKSTPPEYKKLFTGANCDVPTHGALDSEKEAKITYNAFIERRKLKI